MRKIALVLTIAAALQSCSLLQRQEEEEDPNAPPFAPQESLVSEPGSGGVANGQGGLETEVAQLNTKIAAMETKLDVLSASMERIQLQKSQPTIEAEPMRPQTNMAAPVESESSVASAPERPHALSEAPKVAPLPSAPTSETEKEFRSAMELFQRGKSLEAASRFALVAKKNPNHMLAGHALYWAGEAGARAGQWSLAIENWEELEKFFPRSAYLPDALAGLARAYGNQGNTERARSYRSTLLQSFPKAPVAISMNAGQEAETASASANSPNEEPAPAYSAEPPVEETDVD